jgi:hypothetical protein
VTIDLGTALAGRSVRFGWRVACDDLGLSPGWELDDVRFTGVTNRPFSGLVADAGTACDAHRPVARVMDLETVSGASATLDGSASSDPDGRALTWRWSAEGGTLADAEGPRPTFLAPDVNVETFFPIELVVTDDQGLASMPAKAAVRVKPRPAPEPTTVAPEPETTAPRGTDATTTGPDETTLGADTTTVAAGSADAAPMRGCGCSGADVTMLALCGTLLGRRRRRASALA